MSFDAFKSTITKSVYRFMMKIFARVQNSVNQSSARVLNKTLGHVQVQNGAQRGLRCVFSCLVGVSELQSNQQQHVYKARGIKVNSHNGFKESNLQMCSMQLGIRNN
jgi:hypothetical protein